MVKEIKLTKGLVTIVDDDDFEYLTQWKWYARNGEKGTPHYACRSEYVSKDFQYPVHMHRVLAKTPDGMITDHINGDTLDNRKANLRVCVQHQNIRNMRKSTRPLTSKYKGVSWDKIYKKFRATIKVDYKIKHIGFSDNEEDAATMYNMAALRYHRQFARLNMIPQVASTDT